LWQSSLSTSRPFSPGTAYVRAGRRNVPLCLITRADCWLNLAW
jgi:hypothetical protein